jgi:hypothetical protein
VNFRRLRLLFLTASLAAMLAACGGNSSGPPPSLAFTAGFTPPSSLTAGATAGIAVTVSNGSPNALVNWSVTCGSAGACGSFSPTSTASGVPTTYTAPTTVPSGGTVTITATLSTSSAITISQQITISAAPAITVSLSTAPPSIMTVGTSANIVATVANDTENQGVTWSCTPASACGTFSPTSTASGAATTYTAPATVPGTNPVTITATSVSNTSAFASANVTINAAGAGIAVTLSAPPPSSMNVSAQASVVATVANDSLNQGVTWSCTPASACGSFSPTATASGAATTYTAPATVPTGGTVTVTATSVSNNSAQASANVTITPAGSISVTLSTLPPTSMLIQGTAPVVATVVNDSSNAGVTWSCTPSASAACGSFNPTSTASGAATTYTAPNTVPQGSSVTITATSVANSSASASATVTITSNIAVTFSSGFAPPSSLNINQTAETAATVTGDPNNNGVNWTVTCGSAGACGSFSPTSTGSAVPTTYTAPAAIPTGSTVTITATSISDYTKTVTSNAITITQPTILLPNGTYVFQVTGLDTNAAGGALFNVAGAFTVNTDAITSGEQDFSDTMNGSSNDSILGATSGSSIAATTDGNLQVILASTNTNVGVGDDGLETLNITLTSPSSGLISWFDGFATGTGTFSLQDPTAASTTPVGGYALLSSGYDSSNLELAIGGIPVVASDGSISGYFDVNDAGGAVNTKIPFASTSTVSGPDSFGRVQFTLDSSTLPEIILAGYIANASAMSLVETADTYTGFTGGTALAQGTNTGNFSNSNSLLNTSYAFATQGSDSQPFLNLAGSLTFSTDTSIPTDLAVSGNATLNDIASQLSGAMTGTALVDSTGRATVFGLALPTSTTPRPLGHIQLYLDGNGNALMASMNATDVLAGPAFEQTASATVSGNYAMNAIGISESTLNLWSAVGPINVASNTIGAGSFTDFNYYGAAFSATQCGVAGNTCPDVTVSGTLSTTTGSITGLGADSLLAGSPSANSFNVYPIDSSHAFAIESDGTQLGLLYLGPYTATPSAGTRNPATSRTGAKIGITRMQTVKSQTAK